MIPPFLQMEEDFESSLPSYEIEDIDINRLIDDFDEIFYEFKKGDKKRRKRK